MEPSVTLDEADPGDVPTLRRLMQRYLYEIGSDDGWDIGADGLYGNAERIERFWSEPGLGGRRVQPFTAPGGRA